MNSSSFVRRALLCGGFFLAGFAFAAQPATLAVDATDAPRNLLHVKESIPVSPGVLTLFYPKWIPGEHGPTGPVVDLVGLHIRSDNAPDNMMAWRRDPVEMHAYKVDVPPGATRLDLEFDFILPPNAEGFSSGASSTSQLAVISWNQVVLYPLQVRPDDFKIAPSLKLPAGWKYATALKPANAGGAVTQFAPVSLTQLVDSPVQAGAHTRRVSLATNGPAVTLDLAADSEAALALPPESEAGFRQLVTEARALFGAEHYGSYDFLYTLSDKVARFGLEHHESSDDRTWERSFLDDDQRRLAAGLLPHEYVHSWNGKYRRPADLATNDFSTPMHDDLLWVYEGLTEYLGNVLTARSGLRTTEEYRDNLARIAAYLNARPGRTWRSLQDTADQAQVLYYTRPDYDALRRSVDFYDEGDLVWLEIDVTIRKLTNGGKSLDDFCRAFHGAPSTAPMVKPYNFNDVVTALNSVVAHDWRTLLLVRLQALKATAPLEGVESGGWKLAFTDKPGPMSKANEAARKVIDARFSLGAMIVNDGREDGLLLDVIPGTPAARAGLAPGMKLIGINLRRYSADVLRDALKAGVNGTAPLAVLAENRDYFSTSNVDYHGGERYPTLERDPGKPDVLSDIIAAKAPGGKK
jgi:predicted metalloprotease with PDZ domain